MTFRTTKVLVAASMAALVATGVAVAAISPIKRYAVELTGTGYETKRLLSVGDTVPETSNPALRYQMVGIPDGLGAHRNADGTRTVYMNHELEGSVSSEPVVGQPLNRGAFVSKLTLDRDGNVLSGERAYDRVFIESQPGPGQPPAEVGNATRPFSRFCSGSLAGPREGFDRYIYLTNEEEGTPANTFDGMGGLAVAIVDNALYTLPKLGRFAWENTVVQPTQGNKTVILGLEDGPSALAVDTENSALYMYVGTKDGSASHVLRRNGLDNGQLYVLVRADGTAASEADFGASTQDKTISVKWQLIPNAGALSESQLEAASDAAKAIRFARTEDGAFNTRNSNQFFFVTTGSNGSGAGPHPNNLGRLYSLQINASDPTATGSLTTVYNADEIIAAGGDVAISPDNIDTNESYLMIQEDGTGSPAGSRAVMAAKGRDGSIWRFDLDDGPVGVDPDTATRIVQLDPPGRDGVAVTPGTWETSGIIDASALFGDGTWLFDVQAHPPTTAPGANTVEDGQLLLLVGSDNDRDDDDQGDSDQDQ